MSGVEGVLPIIVLVGALGFVVAARLRRRDAPVADPAPTFEPDRRPPRPRPQAEVPASTDPGVELERVAIRRLREEEVPARSWTDDVGVIEAWWVLGAAAPVPPGREALAAFVHAVREGRLDGLDTLDGSVQVQVEALLARREPARVAAWEEARGLVPGRALVLGLAAVGRAGEALLRVPDPGPLLGEVVVAGIDAGVRDERLEAAWSAAEPDAWARNDRAWLGVELRRLVRLDRDAALTLYQRLSEAEPLPVAVLEDFFTFWMKGEGRRLEGLAGEGTDLERAARLLGAARAGAEVRLELPRLRGSLAEPQPDLLGLFGLVVRTDLVRGEVSGLRETVEVAGAAGWQVASAAWEGLRRVPTGRREALLAELRRPVPPGPLARSGGTPPPWFRAPQPRPVELLSLYAALGPDGPWWPAAPGEGVPAREVPG